MDCGYYKAIYGDTEYKNNAKDLHIENLNRFLSLLKNKYGTEYYYSAYLINIDDEGKLNFEIVCENLNK